MSVASCRSRVLSISVRKRPSSHSDARLVAALSKFPFLLIKSLSLACYNPDDLSVHGRVCDTQNTVDNEHDLFSID